MTATLLPPGQSALDLAFPNLSSVLRVETAMCASQLAADYLRAGETPTTWHQGKKREIALMLGNAGYLPILQRLESCLNELTTVGIGAAHLKRINTLGLLAGPREKCLSGIAEIVGLAWLSRTGALLPGASSEIAKSESPHAHTKSVDAVLDGGAGVEVPCDVKSEIAHVDFYLRDIEDAISVKLGRTVHLRQLGIAKPDMLREQESAIVAWGVSAAGADGSEWQAPDHSFRLRFASMSGGFRAGVSEYVRLLERVVAQGKQVSTLRPSMLMLVRTAGMGFDYFVDDDSLQEVFLRSVEAQKFINPLFGSGASTYQRWEVIRPYLSAFLYLNDSRGEAFLVKNPYCRKQISPTLEGNLVNAGAVIVT